MPIHNVPVKLLANRSPGRSCSGCTKCCEGWLSGQVRGHQMYPGVPCHFVKLGSACGIYENRPEDPCQNFHCEWLINDEIPDYLRPASSGIILVERRIENFDYLLAVSTGEDFNDNLLSWIIQYGFKKFGNVAWKLKSQEMFCIGNNDFVTLLESTP